MIYAAYFQRLVTQGQNKSLLGHKAPMLGCNAWPVFDDEASNTLSTLMGMAECYCSANPMPMRGVLWSPLMPVLHGKAGKASAKRGRGKGKRHMSSVSGPPLRAGVGKFGRNETQ